tara:strand:+ start:369 stop:758 length:390 start_codon:yes stop_codon:yes gene_type:complete
MLLGHGAIGQFSVAEALPGFSINAGTVELTLGQSTTTSAGTLGMTGSAVFATTGPGITSSIGNETVTAGATFSVDGSQFTANIGDETVLGEAFQNIINFSLGTPNFFLWSEIDDSQTVTWIDVEPGSTD